MIFALALVSKWKTVIPKHDRGKDKKIKQNQGTKVWKRHLELGELAIPRG